MAKNPLDEEQIDTVAEQMCSHRTAQVVGRQNTDAGFDRSFAYDARNRFCR